MSTETRQIAGRRLVVYQHEVQQIMHMCGRSDWHWSDFFGGSQARDRYTAFVYLWMEDEKMI
jgi:hypothetical protein